MPSRPSNDDARLKPLLRVVVVLMLVHLPWPGLPRAFGSYFSAVTAPQLQLLAEQNVRVDLAPTPPTAKAPPWTVVVTATETSNQGGAKAELDVRRVGWLPLGAFLALLVALPPKRWKRRAAVAAGGLLVLQVLWTLPVLAAFGTARGGFFALGSVGQTLVVTAQRALQTLPGMAYAMPGLLWFLLTWRIERELM